MNEKNIVIDGKEYISSDRAAKLVGYTKDYVGQLARAGKIKSKRIGRSWYIEEDSISKHKLSVHYILTKPKKKNISYSQENNSDEKTIRDIDISVNFIHQEKESGDSKYERSFADNVTEKHEVSYVSSHQDEFDLIPKIPEKKRGAFLHTDIRYEPVVTKTASYIDSVDVAAAHKNKHETDHFKPVQIRKRGAGRLSRSLKNVTSGIDGVMTVIETKRNPRMMVQQNEVQSHRTFSHIQKKNMSHDIPYRERDGSPSHYDVKKIKDRDDEYEPVSKAIPVVGGVVLFTIFVVIYLLFAV